MYPALIRHAREHQLAPCSPPCVCRFPACADPDRYIAAVDVVLRDAAAVASSLQLGRQIAMSHSGVGCGHLTNHQADEWTSSYNPYCY